MEFKSLIFFALIAVSSAGGICPSSSEYGVDNNCNCYENINLVVCENLKAKFEFAKKYSFETLVLKNTEKLGFLLDHITKKPISELSTKSLILLQDSEIKTPNDLENLGNVLGLPTETIKVVSTVTPIPTINCRDLQAKTIKTISLTNIKSFEDTGPGLYLQDFEALTNLQLNNVTFKETTDQTSIYDTPLNEIELINTNLKGIFSIFLKTCPGRIRIELHKNPGLTEFNFAALIKDEKLFCDFHIDLSDSSFDENFLNKYTAQLVKTMTTSQHMLSLQLRNIDIQCNCGLYNLSMLPNVQLHGIHCKKENKYLDQLSKTDLCGKH